MLQPTRTIRQNVLSWTIKCAHETADGGVLCVEQPLPKISGTRRSAFFFSKKKFGKQKNTTVSMPNTLTWFASPQPWYGGAGIAQSVRGSNPGGGEIFRTCPDRSWGPPSLLYKGYRVFPGGKAAGAWRWPPTPTSAEVKERVELYLYSPYGPSWPVIRWNSLFTSRDTDVLTER